MPGPCTPPPAVCWTRSPSSAGRGRVWPGSPASRPIHATCRPAARSIHAAPGRWTGAGRICPPSSRWRAERGRRRAGSMIRTQPRQQCLPPRGPVMATEHNLATAASGDGGAVPQDDIVLEARHLSRHYVVSSRGRAALTQGGRTIVRAVDDVSLALARRQVAAVVGESGSGKSTLARLLARLERPSGGEVLLEGRAVAGRSARALRPFRRQVQMIFQDPFASLNSV